MRALKKAYLEITNLCNLNCSFCPGTRRPSGILSPENFHILAQRLRPHTQYLYLHVMGEPLLHPQLEQILSIANELGFRIMITTNGTLLKQYGHLLYHNPAVQKVSISLHSFEGNSSPSGLESYLEQCFAFASQCSQWGTRCALRLWNLDGPQAPGANTQNQVILQQLAHWFPPPWKEDWQGTTIGSGVYLEWGERFTWPDLSSPEEESSGFCKGLRDQIGVLCDGTVVPCCLDHEGDIPLGNLFQQDLEEILSGSRAQAIYQGFSQRRAVEPLCQRCGYRKRFS